MSRIVNLTLPNDRGITSFTHDSFELTFGALDYMLLPVPSNFNHFVINFYVYTIGDNTETFIILQNNDLSKKWIIEITDSSKLSVRENLQDIEYIDITNATYFLFTWVFTGSAYKIYIDNVLKLTHTTVNNLSDFTKATIKATYVDGVGYVFNAGADSLKIKNPSGLYQFGTAYTDISQETEAGVNDAVASIKNLGFRGSSMTQETVAARPTLTEETSITLKRPKVTIP